MSEGIFPYQLQNEERISEFWVIFNSTQSKLQEASGNSKQFGAGCYRESRALSFFLFKAQLTEKRQHMKNSLEGTAWQQNARKTDCCMPGNGDCLNRV